MSATAPDLIPPPTVPTPLPGPAPADPTRQSDSKTVAAAVRIEGVIRFKLKRELLETCDSTKKSVAQYLLDLNHHPEIQLALCRILSDRKPVSAVSPHFSGYAVWSIAARVAPLKVCQIVCDLTKNGTCVLDVPVRSLNAQQQLDTYPKTLSAEQSSDARSVKDVFETSLLQWLTPPHFVLDTSSSTPVYVCASHDSATPEKPEYGSRDMFRPARITLFDAARLITDLTGQKFIPVCGQLAQDIAQHRCYKPPPEALVFTVNELPRNDGTVVLTLGQLNRLTRCGANLHGLLIRYPDKLSLSDALEARLNSAVMFHDLLDHRRAHREAFVLPHQSPESAPIYDTAMVRLEALDEVERGRYKSLNADAQISQVKKGLWSVFPAKQSFHPTQDPDRENLFVCLKDAREILVGVIASGALGDTRYEIVVGNKLRELSCKPNPDGSDSRASLSQLALSAITRFGAFPHTTGLLELIKESPDAQSKATWLQFIAAHVSTPHLVSAAIDPEHNPELAKKAGVTGWLTPDQDASARSHSVRVEPPTDDPRFDTLRNEINPRWRLTIQQPEIETAYSPRLRELLGGVSIFPTRFEGYDTRSTSPVSHTHLSGQDVGKLLPELILVHSHQAKGNSPTVTAAIDTLLQKPAGVSWLTTAIRSKSLSWIAESTVVPKLLEKIERESSKSNGPVASGDLLAIFERVSKNKELSQTVLKTLEASLTSLSKEQLVHLVTALKQTSNVWLNGNHRSEKETLYDVAFANLRAVISLAALTEQNNTFSNYCIDHLPEDDIVFMISKGIRDDIYSGTPEFCAGIALASARERRGLPVVVLESRNGLSYTRRDPSTIRDQVIERFGNLPHIKDWPREQIMTQRIIRLVAAIESSPDVARCLSDWPWTMSVILGHPNPGVRSALGNILARYPLFSSWASEDGVEPPKLGRFATRIWMYFYFRDLAKQEKQRTGTANSVK